MCGYRASSSTLISSSLKFRNWSTLFNVPWIAKSFFSSTVTVCPVNVLNAEHINLTVSQNLQRTMIGVASSPSHKEYGTQSMLTTMAKQLQWRGKQFDTPSENKTPLIMIVGGVWMSQKMERLAGKPFSRISTLAWLRDCIQDRQLL